jgi:hypothetical protein
VGGALHLGAAEMFLGFEGSQAMFARPPSGGGTFDIG